MSYMRDADGVRLDTLSVAARLTAVEADVVDHLITLAYAEDTANAALPLSNGVFTPLPLTFAVPPSTLDVTLSWGGALQITAAGNGGITVAPCDVTNGGVLSTFASVSGTLAGAFLAGTFSVGPTFNGSVNIGPSATWRMYRLYGFVGRDSASTLAASYRASGAAPYTLKSWMKAVLG